MGSGYNRRAKSSKVDFAFKQGALLDTMFQQFQFGNSPTAEQKEAMDDQFKTILAKDPSYLTAEEQAFLLNIDKNKATPAMQEYFKENMSAKNADRFTKRYKPFFSLLQQGVDIGSAIGQINTAKDASGRLVRPVIPQPSGIDPALNNEIRNAQAATFDSARALAPAQQEIASAYNQSDVVDKAISGGQSAVYGARRQKASIERMRAGLQLPAIADEIKRREQSRLSQLIGMRQQAAIGNDQTRMTGARMATDQYNSDVTAIGQLGAQGRTNLRNTMTTLPDNLLGSAGRFVNPPATNPYSGGVSPMEQAGVSPMGQVSIPANSGPYSNYEANLNQAIVNNTNKIREQQRQQLLMHKNLLRYNYQAPLPQSIYSAPQPDDYSDYNNNGF
jgi:predicted  nucleic acid-binding Zn ribbon protein